MGQWLPVKASLQLFFADGLPELVDRFDRVARDLFDRKPEMFCPESAAGGDGELGIVEDEVHLGVVEQRMLVQVRGAKGQPGVVDDSDLGVNLDGVGQPASAGVGRAGYATPPGVYAGSTFLSFEAFGRYRDGAIPRSHATSRDQARPATTRDQPS